MDMDCPPDRELLTIPQARIYEFLVNFFHENDQLPPTRTIQAHFGHGSQTAAVQFLSVLVRKGWLEKNEVGKYKFVRPIIPPSYRD